MLQASSSSRIVILFLKSPSHFWLCSLSPNDCFIFTRLFLFGFHTIPAAYINVSLVTNLYTRSFLCDVPLHIALVRFMYLYAAMVIPVAAAAPIKHHSALFA